jgi:tetratricopeptide (TPR) repeat protein
MTTTKTLEKAMSMRATGDFEGAVAGCIRALEAGVPAAVEPALWHDLGVLLRKLGRLSEAEAAFVRAIALAPEDPDAWLGLGLVQADRGEPEVAVEAHRRALTLRPSPEAFVHLGNALRSAGDRVGAVDAFRAAIGLDPRLAAAQYNLHAAIYDDGDPSSALTALDSALSASPEHVFARFFRQVLVAWHHGTGREADGPPDASFLDDSLDFILERRNAETRLFSDTFETLRHAATLAEAGAVVELGVRRGTSLRFLAGLFPDRALYGFDSFEGLPEPWGDQPRGLYTTGGRLPAVPDHVLLHVGWFAETLPAFAAQLSEPIAFVHVDCDLHASTRTALEQLAPRLSPGAVLVFDDYLCNPGWRDEEHRAFLEVAAAERWRYRYAAFSPFSRQAVVVLQP